MATNESEKDESIVASIDQSDYEKSQIFIDTHNIFDSPVKTLSRGYIGDEENEADNHSFSTISNMIGRKLLGPASNSCGSRSDFIALVEVS